MRKVTTALLALTLLGITGCSSAGENGQDLEAERVTACADAMSAINSLERSLRAHSGVTSAAEEAAAIFEEIGQRDLGETDGGRVAPMYSSVANGLDQWGGNGQWSMNLDYDMLKVKAACEDN